MSWKHQKLYKQAGKCDDQHQLKNIPEAAIVSTPEVFTNESTISPMASAPVKKPSDRKPLCIFTNILGMRKKTATRRVGYAESKHKVIKYGTTTWELKKKRKGH